MPKSEAGVRLIYDESGHVIGESAPPRPRIFKVHPNGKITVKAAKPAK